MRVEIEIEASPAQVRAVILDFPRYSEWHSSFIKSISVLDPPNKPPAVLEKGDKLRAAFTGASIEPTIESNTLNEFRWYGSSMLNAFAGYHFFEYRESKITPGGTTFVHGEDYTGWATFLFEPPSPMHSSIKEMFMGYCRDLKARVEEIKVRETKSSVT